MDTRRGNDKSVQRRSTKRTGETKGSEISLLEEMINLMTTKKVLSATMGEMTVHLSPMAFDTGYTLTPDGNNAENIDELLYIKRPQNGFPTI